MGQRFFDQDVEAELHQAASDFRMGHGGRRHDSGVGGSSQILEAFKDRTLMGLGCCGGSGKIDIEDSGEDRVFRGVDDSKMIAAECTGASDRDSGSGHVSKRLTRPNHFNKNRRILWWKDLFAQMRLLRQFLFAVLLTAMGLPLPVSGQRYNFKFYGEEEGLQNLVVQVLVQDRAGFLWVGTQNGLFRYDGS